jgi:hypothetical protein
MAAWQPRHTHSDEQNGNPGSLVASHPGNTNAVKYGVHSPRLIAARATEIEDQLTCSFDFSVTQRFAVNEVARVAAMLEAIDRDVVERGVVDKRGEPHSVVNLRSRDARQLDHWLTKIAPVIERAQQLALGGRDRIDRGLVGRTRNRPNDAAFEVVQAGRYDVDGIHARDCAEVDSLARMKLGANDSRADDLNLDVGIAKLARAASARRCALAHVVATGAATTPSRG